MFAGPTSVAGFSRARNEAGWPGPSPLAGNATCARALRLPRRVGAGLWSRDQAPSDHRSYSSAARITGMEHDARNRSGRVPAAQRARLAPRPWPANLVATSQCSTSDRGALGQRPERSGRIGETLRAVTAKTLKRAGAVPPAAAPFRPKRSRGFVVNRCFTGVRQTPADAAS